MKNKIKKRVEGNKKNISGIIMVIFVVFILIVGCVFIYINKDLLIDNLKKDNKVKNDDKEVVAVTDKDLYKAIDINSPNIVNLFNLVHSDTVDGDATLYHNKKMDVSEMDEFYKFSLIKNIYDGQAMIFKNAGLGEITASIDEKKVKQAYESFFGLNTYKKLDEIPYECTTMQYDSLNKRYITTNQVCGSISPFYPYEKIISAKKNDSELLITGAVVFVYDYAICRDYDCTKVIDNNSSAVTGFDYLDKYIETNKDNLMQYTYKFKLNDDGFYYYQGFERTKE